MIFQGKDCAWVFKRTTATSFEELKCANGTVIEATTTGAAAATTTAAAGATTGKNKSDFTNIN